MLWIGKRILKPHNLATLLDVPGVYRLWTATPEPIPLYVGSTNRSLKRKIALHLLPSEPNPCIREALAHDTCYFDFIMMTSESNRRWTEKSEIMRLNPRCNAGAQITW